jgi:hypothetical protein
MNARLRALIILPLVLAACGGRDAAKEEPAVPPPAAPTSQDAASGMKGMPGMQGAGSGTMSRMQADMRSMQGAGGDSLKAMLPVHRQMAANMIAEMNREMRDMNMGADAAWTATVDSLRQDLVRMPEMGASELQSFMPAHQARLERLMEMHRAMSPG